ncbi:MAG: response regulator transcription factor [Caldilineaceae bacterium]|nr:response regulator transcription factor [Caldilineaceae bacterium]
MAALLQAFVQQAGAAGYAQRLLAAFPRPQSDGAATATTPPRQTSLVEPLSDRELEVLVLIAAGHSNREIGAQLFIEVGTVKRHITNIFGKLGATSRTQAIAVARQLGLLP